MLLTDCYPLKLIGMANSTSRENETAAVSKAVAGAKFGSTLLQGRRALFILRNNCDCANKVSTDHHTAKIQQKVLCQTCFSVRHHSLQSHYTVHSYIFGIEILLFLLI